MSGSTDPEPTSEAGPVANAPSGTQTGPGWDREEQNQNFDFSLNPADGLAAYGNRTCNSDSETAAGQPGRRPAPRACKSAAIAGFGEGQGCWQPAGRRCCGRHCLGRCRGWPVHLLSRKAGRAASRVRIARKIRPPRSTSFDDVQIEGLSRAWSADGLPWRSHRVPEELVLRDPSRG